jgi:hypothetical protein
MLLINSTALQFQGAYSELYRPVHFLVLQTPKS